MAHVTRLSAGPAHATPGTWRFLLFLFPLCVVAAMIAARLPAPAGEALWNLDLPKIDAPLAVFFHEALGRGELPLWQERLGLGFPLYAEGQIGAFYPPNWLIHRFEPLVALDVNRVVHLTVAGLGTGLLALRLSGSRSGALIAAAVAILGGGIVSKLEWNNLVAAYAWLPWILLPLARRPAPSRIGLVLAGVGWGIQALAGHPNTWLLTGLLAVVLLLATGRDLASLGRVVLFGLVGGAIGSIQLLPTLLLTALSVRDVGVTPDDAFTAASTPFDPLGFFFAQPFIRTGEDGWDIFTTWYPDGIFALYEASAFIGLGVLALAAVAVPVRRARPWLVVAGVMLAIPVLAALRPDPWLAVPILNGLRSPTRAYLFVAFILGLLAAIGVARLGRATTAEANGTGRRGTPFGRAATAVGLAGAAWLLTLGIAVILPSVWEAVFSAVSTRLPGEGAGGARENAIKTLSLPLPLILELVAGTVVVILIGTGRRTPAVVAAVVAATILPLALLSPLANTTRAADRIWPRDSELAVALRAIDPNRVLTLGPPGFYDGAPDRLAAAGVPDLEMFSSLNLRASDDLLEAARGDGPDAAIVRRLVGVDTLVTFGASCPGTDPVSVEADEAEVCRVPALTGPYWIPEEAVPSDGRAADDGGSPIAPRDVVLDLAAAEAGAVPALMIGSSSGELALRIEAPADGYVWVDRAWWPSWTVEVDGHAVTPRRALGGQLVPVPAGGHDLTMRLVPWESIVGLVFGVVVATLAIVWAISPWARRRS
ncbi:MAG TPA: hypothetical protein VD763_02515 [Candidatus Saccharimonadales bacterium]|nr:hypothetical protein [Candidatus Saccharimonadales bacterium]